MFSLMILYKVFNIYDKYDILFKNYLQINTNIALSASLANERSPLAYYSNDAFCVQDVSGSSWTLSNPFTSSTETDSTMKVSCS